MELEQEEMMVVYKNGKRSVMPKECWRRLTPAEQAEYSTSAEIKATAGDVEVRQHTKNKSKTIKIPVEENVIEEPVAKPEIEPNDRDGLKEWFGDNPHESYYAKMSTKKMYELYKSLTDANKE